jgi:hypothetical protein
MFITAFPRSEAQQASVGARLKLPVVWLSLAATAPSLRHLIAPSPQSLSASQTERPQGCTFLQQQHLRLETAHAPLTASTQPLPERRLVSRL